MIIPRVGRFQIGSQSLRIEAGKVLGEKLLAEAAAPMGGMSGEQTQVGVRFLAGMVGTEPIPKFKQSSRLVGFQVCPDELFERRVLSFGRLGATRWQATPIPPKRRRS